MKPKYSVLIMGKTQAGKSTLVEHIKNYANPNYNIDTTLLGNGNVSKTRVPRTFLVESTLPVYEVYKIATGETISLDNLSAKFDYHEDYHEFVITSESDTAHAINIISEVINTRTFNLIVITVSYKSPVLEQQQLALEYYANVFKGLHSRIVFLHTHVDYTEIHHTNKVHHTNMDMKNKALSKMFRRHESEVFFDEENFQEYPSFTIDMVSKKRPVISCLIRNTIREILKMATGPAVQLDTSIQNIERIRDITQGNNRFADEKEIGSDKTLSVLSEALKTISTLTTLSLQNNWIRDNGARALSEVLKTNATLTTLDLGST
ncbi:hypothetical protein BGZ74_006149 [Mortierella antarctica]|nr:hypothetical protein BGZ74_006149 [Mortierella antarctica]